MTRQQWQWTFRGPGGDVLDRPLSPVFTTRFDAESWIGEHWRHLAEQGVAVARLRLGEEPVGPDVRFP